MPFPGTVRSWGPRTPEQAAEGTIRKVYGRESICSPIRSTVADSDENARIEIDFFFKPAEIVG